MKDYRKVELLPGCHISSAINDLQRYNEPVCAEFNGKTIYSDDSLDSAYKKVTGKTKTEFDEEERQMQAAYEREKREHEEAIPKLTTEWIEKGKAILDEKYHELWDKIVPVRLGDIYRGMELGACLDIVEQLNKGCELDKSKEMIEEQGHSGMSFGLVCSMVKQFCDRGNEFIEYLNKNKL